jgi:hypothetical protein
LLSILDVAGGILALGLVALGPVALDLVALDLVALDLVALDLVALDLVALDLVALDPVASGLHPSHTGSPFYHQIYKDPSPMSHRNPRISILSHTFCRRLWCHRWAFCQVVGRRRRLQAVSIFKSNGERMFKLCHIPPLPPPPVFPSPVGHHAVPPG